MVYKLADVCDVRDGTHDSPKYVSEGYPLVTSKNIVDGKLDLSIVSYLSQEDYDKINERSKVDSGDIIMPMIGTIGNPYLVEEYSNFAIKNVALIKFPNADISNKFVWYFLKSPAFKRYVDEKNKGGTQKFLSLGDIRNMEIPQISIDKQLSIVEKMEKISSVLRLRQQELDALDDLIKSRFVELFGDPRSNPFGFEKKRLKDTCKVITGNTPSRAIAEYYGDYIEWIKTDNIVSGILNPTQATESLSEKGMNVGRTVEKDSILMACIAGSIASIGRVCVTDRTVAFNQQINAVVPEQYNILFLYVLLQISKDYLVEDINMALKGILSKSKLEEKEFIVPPMELQEQFADFVHQVDKLKLAVQKSLDETQELFDSLMQKYFG